MRERADEPARVPGWSITRPTVFREALRALVAFALYLVLYPLWMKFGGHDAHQRVVVTLGNAVARATQHFPVVSSLENLKVTYLDFAIILCLSYALASYGAGWAARARRFGVLMVVILASHVLGFVLESQVSVATDLFGQHGLLLFLPWEFAILDRLRYFVVEFGLNIWPFVIILLGAAWNAGISFRPPRAARAVKRLIPPSGTRTKAGPRLDSRPSISFGRVVVGVVFAVGICAIVGAWRQVRESDPRHVEAHVVLGNLFLSAGHRDKAYEQFRIAIEHGTTNGEAWLNAARIRWQEGQPAEAVRLLERARNVVSDATWKHRVDEAAIRISDGNGRGDL